MEICRIFDQQLYSFIYETNTISEYDKKFDEWGDFEFIINKAIENDIEDIDNFYNEIFLDREYLRLKIDDAAANKSFIDLFKNLHNKSTAVEKFEESKLKFKVATRKYKLSRLRLYALRIKTNCFFVTGGAIKFTQEMDKHPDTRAELVKIKKCKQYLIDQEHEEDSILENIID